MKKSSTCSSTSVSAINRVCMGPESIGVVVVWIGPEGIGVALIWIGSEGIGVVVVVVDVVDAIVSGRGGVVDGKEHSDAFTGEGVVGTGESVMLKSGHTVLLSPKCSNKQNGLVIAIAVTMLTFLSLSGLSGRAPNVR